MRKKWFYISPICIVFFHYNTRVIEEMEVVGTTARSGLPLGMGDIPALVQSLDMGEYISSHLPALG